MEPETLESEPVKIIPERVAKVQADHMNLVVEHSVAGYSVDEIVNGVAGLVLNLFLTMPPQSRSPLELYDLFMKVTRTELVACLYPSQKTDVEVVK